MKLNYVTALTATAFLVSHNLIGSSDVAAEKIVTNSYVTETAFANAIVPTSAVNFKDLPTNHWAYSSVQAAVQKGYLSGYTDGTFRPSANVTRAEMMAILSRLSDTPNRSTVTFSDVPSTHWAYDAIAEGIAIGLIKPADYANGKFNPNQIMTRQEIANWIANMLIASNSEYDQARITMGTSNLTLLPIAEHVKGQLPKADVGRTGLIIGTNIMSGYTDGTFKPKANTTRAEVASMLVRIEAAMKKSPKDFTGLQELVAVSKTGTNFYVLGGRFVNENLGRNWENLRKEGHVTRNGYATVYINRMILVDTRDKENFKGIYKDMFYNAAKEWMDGVGSRASSTLLVEHKLKMNTKTSNGDWYDKISPSQRLLMQSIYADSRYGFTTTADVLKGWKLNSNGEQLLWGSAAMTDDFGDGVVRMSHLVNEKDYSMRFGD